MNFLALAQFVRQECEIPGTGPAAVTSQVGELKRIVDWTATAWEDIQNLKANWRWMRRPFTFNTAASDGSYAYTDATDTIASAAIDRFGQWWHADLRDPMLCYLSSGGVAQQYPIWPLTWEDFRWLYRHGTQNDGQPIHVSVDHQDNLVLGPTPDDTYVITGDYQRSMQVMTADADIPEMPTQYHKLIGYYAMHKYGGNSVAAEIVARAQTESARLLTALKMNQLPRTGVGEPLA